MGKRPCCAGDPNAQRLSFVGSSEPHGSRPVTSHFWGVTRVVGIGIVKFRLPNGRFVMLSDVCHVPGMKRNLISLGVLDGKGYSFSTSEGILRVRQEERVMLEGSLVHGLYRLEGSVERDDMSYRHSVGKKVWHVKSQVEEPLCEAHCLLSSNGASVSGVDEEELCTKERISFAQDLVSDVFVFASDEEVGGYQVRGCGASVKGVRAIEVWDRGRSDREVRRRPSTHWGGGGDCWDPP
ncbi:hypothetical protein RHMOL_Rhmol05G0165700 [Rhododendron molle]|uniref:Uncharacterized protein n=1 Tax=Rhododendron molle TaxID=49168 RepID=A0ACC0NPM9_RHOML|nr:hypothetical protein RHMOL_Rhmol05G0165700 [Rhododendron molle]